MRRSKRRSAPTSRPADVVAGFLALHAFRTIYIADLDAIEGTGSHSALHRGARGRVSRSFVLGRCRDRDGGRSDCVARRASRRSRSWQRKFARRSPLHASHELPRTLLSLDFRGELFQGPPHLNEDESALALRVIVMTLARVGSHAGPISIGCAASAPKQPGVMPLCRRRRSRSGRLGASSKAGVAGVLVASALHDGGIGVRGSQA